MPIVTIQQAPRSIELKRELVRRITDAVAGTYQLPPEAVQVWINETPTESWGIGGILMSERKSRD